MPKLKEKTEWLYVRSMGKALRITAIFTNDDDANRFMERNPDDAVVACFAGLVFLARKYDRGVTIADR